MVPTTDPLRVLRAVRFATRFQFDLEDSLLEAAASEKASDGRIRQAPVLLLLVFVYTVCYNKKQKHNT